MSPQIRNRQSPDSEELGLKDTTLAVDRFMVVGSWDSAETAGPTAAAFGRTEKDNTCLYVTTTGGLLNPAWKSPVPARAFRVDVGVSGEA